MNPDLRRMLAGRPVAIIAPLAVACNATGPDRLAMGLDLAKRNGATVRERSEVLLDWCRRHAEAAS